jgi:hypothetical protein
MNEIPENPEEIESVTEEAAELANNPVSLDEPVQAAIEPEQAGRPWRKIALLVGGGVITAAGAAMTTLAATHKSAVRENFKAYANGLVDGVEAYKNGR